MPVMRSTCLQAGELIDNAERLLSGTHQFTELTTLQEFSQAFSNAYVFQVAVVFVPADNQAKIVTTLRDQHNSVVDTLSYSSGPIDRKYELSHDDDGYEVTITRAANSQLTADAVQAYLAADGNHCPFCGSSEFHAAVPQQVDSATLTMLHRCANCEASWQTLFTLQGINNDPATYTPPRQNVVSR